MSSSPTLPPAPALPRFDRKLTPPPSLNAQSDVRVQAAIAASARAEASLSGLFRAIQSLDTGLGGAREANELLTRELEAIRDMVGNANEQQLAAKQKATLLEQALERTRKDAERERKFLTEQHDAFIVDLMDEQEGELARRDTELHALRERIAEFEKKRELSTVPPPFEARNSERVRSAAQLDEGTALDRAERAELERTAQKLAEDRERARETMHRLQLQRDEAQSAVTRVTKERDDALEQVFRLKAELGGPRIPLSSRPPMLESRKTEPPSAPAPAITSIVSPPRSSPLAAPKLNALAAPLSTARPPRSIRTHASSAPEELRRALTSSPALQPIPTSSRPPLKQKPDASTRPLVGYSLNDEIEPEQLEGVRLSKPPSQRR